MPHSPARKWASAPSFSSAASGVTVASSAGEMPRTMAPRMSSPRAIKAWAAMKGAAPMTAGFCFACAAVARQSGKA